MPLLQAPQLGSIKALVQEQAITQQQQVRCNNHSSDSRTAGAKAAATGPEHARPGVQPEQVDHEGRRSSAGVMPLGATQLHTALETAADLAVALAADADVGCHQCLPASAHREAQLDVICMLWYSKTSK